MTTYILHGGDVNTSSESNNVFFSQFTQSVEKDTVNIVCVYWAQEEERWQDTFREHSQKILENSVRDCNLTLVYDEKELYQLLPEADVVYFHGGRIHLVDQITQPETFKKLLKDKVYIGSSMGAYLVSTYYMVSSRVTDKLEVKQGLGLLPFSIVAHWDAANMQRQKRVQLLNENDSSLPILTIDEQKYKKIVY